MFHNDSRRKRLLFRSWHRGMREVDFILGGFANKYIGSMTDSELEVFERLLDENDNQILIWILTVENPPQYLDQGLLQRIRDFHINNIVACN